MTLRRPNRLMYPQGLLEGHQNRLRIRLRRIVKDVWRGNVSVEAAETLGVNTIEDAYKAILRDYTAYLAKRGRPVKVDPGNEELTSAKEEALEGWRGVIRDLPDTQG